MEAIEVEGRRVNCETDWFEMAMVLALALCRLKAEGFIVIEEKVIEWNAMNERVKFGERTEK